jgi:hypothetical protein
MRFAGIAERAVVFSTGETCGRARHRRYDLVLAFVDARDRMDDGDPSVAEVSRPIRALPFRLSMRGGTT